MAVPTITFNSSTGSDTQASGAGPATALFGTGAALASNTSIDLSADAPTLTGVDITGLATIWVATSSGRQHFKITNVNNTTKIVTVDDAAAVTESGRTWGIGGKRATWDAASSRRLFTNDAKAGWTIQTETNQAITSTTINCNSAIGDMNSARGPITVKGTITAKASRVVISTVGNINILTASQNNWMFRNMLFSCSSGTKTNNTGITQTNNSRGIVVQNCGNLEATPCYNGFFRGTSGFHSATIVDCEWDGCVAVGISAFSGGGSTVAIDSCSVSRNGGDGIYLNSQAAFSVTNCFICDNVGDGIDLEASFSVDDYGPRVIAHNTFDDNGESAIDWDNNPDMFGGVCIHSNFFTNNTGTAVIAPSTSGTTTNNMAVGLFDYNVYFGNGGTVSNITLGANDLTAVDPDYVDAASNDWTPQAAGVVGAAYPGIGNNFPGTSTPNNNFPGPAQSSGGGGGATENFGASWG